MTSKELNLKLIEFLPEIKSMYDEEISWQDGNDTGSHIVFEDVFVPFIKEQACSGNKKILKQAFKVIERLLSLNDEYADEVISFSVIESLIFDDEIDNSLIMQFAGVKTLELVEEIIRYIVE